MRSSALVLAGIMFMLAPETAVFANDKSGPKVFVAGKKIGRLAGFDATYANPLTNPSTSPPVVLPGSFLSTPSLQVITRERYGVSITVDSDQRSNAMSPELEEGQIAVLPVWFDGPACSGTPYFQIVEGRVPRDAAGASPGVSSWGLRNLGLVYGAPDPNDPNLAYYVPRNPGPALEIVPQSIGLRTATGFRCLPIVNQPVPTAVPFRYLPLRPNDPAVTGVPNNLIGIVTIGDD